MDELAAEETKKYWKKVEPMLDKSSAEAIAAVPWRVGNGVQELIQAGWREMWSVGSGDATRELNTIGRKVAKQQKAEFAEGDNYSTLEESNPIMSRSIKAKAKGNSFIVVYPPNYGMPLSRSVLADAVTSRGQAVARSYEGGVQSQIINSINKSILRHRTNTGIPPQARAELLDEIRSAVNPKERQETIYLDTPKDVSGRESRASSAARRVASTELSAAYSLGRLNTYVQAGVQKVRWVNLDRSACAICGDRNGMIYEISELLAQGDNRFDASQHVIPAHPHCRCHYEPVNEEDKDDREDGKNPDNNPVLKGVAAIAGAWTMKQGLKAVASAGLQAVGSILRSQREEQLAQRANRANLIKALALGAGGALALGGLYMLLNEFKKEVDSRSGGATPSGSSVPGISGIITNATQQLESEALRNATEYLREKTAETNAAIKATKAPAPAADVLAMSEKLRNQPSFARLIQANPNLNALTSSQLRSVYGLTEWQIQLLNKETQAFQKRLAAPLWMEASPQRILPDSLRRLYPWLNEYPDLRFFSLEEAIRRTGSPAKGAAVIDYIQKQLRVMQSLPVPGTYQLNGTSVDRFQREDWLALLPPGSTSKEQLVQNIMQAVGQARPSSREELVAILRKAGLSDKAASRAVKGGALAPVNINDELADWQGTVDKAAQKIMDRSGVSRKVAKGIVLEFKNGGSWQGMEDLRRRLEANGIKVSSSTFDALVRAFVTRITPLAEGESGVTTPVTQQLLGLLMDGPELVERVPTPPPTLQQMIAANDNPQAPPVGLQQQYLSWVAGQNPALQQEQSRRIDPGNLADGISNLLGQAATNALNPGVLQEINRSSARDLRRKQIKAILPTRIQESLAAQEKVMAQAAQLKEELQSQVFGSHLAIPGSRLNTRPAQVESRAAIKVAREQAKVAEKLSLLATNTTDFVAELAAKVDRIKAQYTEALGGRGESLTPVDVLSSAYQQDLARLTKEIAEADKALKSSFAPDPVRGKLPISAAEVRLAEMQRKRDELVTMRDSIVDKYQSLVTSAGVRGKISELKSSLSEVSSDLNSSNLGLTTKERAKLTDAEWQAATENVRPLQQQIKQSSQKDFGIADLDSIPLIREIQSQLAATERAIAQLSNASQPDVVSRLANSRAQLKSMLAELNKLPKSKKQLSSTQAARHKQTFGDDKQRNAALKKVGDPLDSLRELSDSEKIRVNPNAETVLGKFRPRTDGTTIFEEELSGIEKTAASGLAARQKAIDKNIALLNLISGPEGTDYVFRNTQRVIDMIDDPQIVAGLGAQGGKVAGLESAAAFRRQVFGLVREKLEKEVLVKGVPTRVGIIPDMERVIDFDTKTRNLSPLLEQTNTALAQEIRNQQTGLKLFEEYEKSIEQGLEGVKRPDGIIQSVGLRGAHLNYYTEVAPEIRNEIKRRKNEYLAKSSEVISQLQEAKSIVEAEIAKPVPFGNQTKSIVELKENLAKTRAAVKASSLVSQDRNTVIGLTHRGLLTATNQKDVVRLINKYMSGTPLTDVEQQFINKVSQPEIDAVLTAQRNGGLDLLFARNKVIPEINRLEEVRGQLWQRVATKVESIRKNTGFQVDISVESDLGLDLSFPSRITIVNPRYVDSPDRFRGGIQAAEARLAKPMAELRGLLGVDIVDGAANISERNYAGVRTLIQRKRLELESIELRMETIGFSRSERLSKFLVRQTLLDFTKNATRDTFSRFSRNRQPHFTPSGRRLLPKLDRGYRHRR